MNSSTPVGAARRKAFYSGLSKLAILIIGLSLMGPALANDLSGVDGDIGTLGMDRTAEVGILADIIVTGVRIMEDFIGPAMGVGLLLGAVNQGARHGDLMGALRYGLGGILCFGIPYLIDLAINFGA
jgi:hypothetical protein